MADTYKRVNWEDSPSIQTPISARNLNIMDKGIDDAHIKASELETNKIDKPSTGKVGQALVVAAVDGNGKPTGFKLVDMNNGTSGGNSSGTQNVVSGVTVAQANTLLAILQKTSFTEQLTQSELSAFKTAWGITDDGSGDNSDTGDSGSGDDTGNDSDLSGTVFDEFILGEVSSCLVASWMKNIAATTVAVSYSDGVKNENGEVALADTVYSMPFYTSSASSVAGQENHYDALKGKFVKSFNGSIYYIDPESEYVHDTVGSEYLSESITYKKAYAVSINS